MPHIVPCHPSSSAFFLFFFSSRRRHTRSLRDWSSDVCSSDLRELADEFSPKSTSRPSLDRRPGPPGGRRGRGRRRAPLRSEERRVGKEGRSRWSAEE